MIQANELIEKIGALENNLMENHLEQKRREVRFELSKKKWDDLTVEEQQFLLGNRIYDIAP